VTTKREIIELAFESIGLAAFTYDLSPEQMDNARKKLDSMMAQWNARGIRLGYPVPSSPDSGDVDEETNLPDAALEAVYLHLAKRIAPGYGKQLTPETKAMAREAFDSLLAKMAKPIEMQMPQGYPLGAGVRTYLGEPAFSTAPTDPILAGNDGPIDFT